ncbi:MAG: alpha/beta fold hydrolase [Nitrospinota bacterium]|nr:alpha/beta fold hydrolase [Nitrospinota bacterium]
MVVKAVRNKKWFAYFPTDYRWSFNTVAAIAGCSSGASDMGEIEQICRNLVASVGDDKKWFREWVRMADRLNKNAQSEKKKAHNLTAASFYKRSSNYYQMADRFRFPKDKRALNIYKESIKCFKNFAKLTDSPKLEVVNIPFEKKKKLPAYFIPAVGGKKTKSPVVVLYNGFDGTKEMSFHWAADAFTRRGMNCLIVDSPGVGESIRFRDIFLRYDYEVAGSAALDYLEKRSDVNYEKVAIVAPSLGGYYASRTASMEKRFKACVAWGAIWDYYATWKRRIDAAFKSQLPVPGHHLTWSFNVKTLDEALEKLERFKLDGVVQNMRCPYLLVHGVDDQQISLKDARSLFRACGSKDKTLKIFDGKEGGSQHCHIDYLSPVVDFMGDWLKEKLF